MHCRMVAACCSLLLVLATALRADDWPTFRHDNHRSGATREQIDAGALSLAWVWRSESPPEPAWAGPARWDAYHGLRGLRSMRNYDPVFHVVAAGRSIWFGSSVDDSVHCLDAATGKQRWSYTADAPVRIAPTVANGLLYFGSDDGYAYCLKPHDGSLVWKYAPASRERLVLNNGRPISHWPCRTGVLVADNTAYFAAGMLPWKESYLCAVDAKTGRPKGPGRYVRIYTGPTMEGAMLSSATGLYIPQGRVPPLLFDRRTGNVVGPLKKGGGGCFVLLTDDDHVMHGPGNKTGWISDSNANSREQVASFPGGNAIVVAGNTAYLLTDHSIAALDRTARMTLWNKPLQYPYELILAGDVLFAGGRDAVAAVDAKTGALLWRHEVSGRAYGLAVAGGSLLVSTDEGAIYCFRPGRPHPPGPSRGEDTVLAHDDQSPLAPVVPVDDQALVGRWVFRQELVKDAAVEDLAGRLRGQITGPIKLARVGHCQALVMDGRSNAVQLAADHSKTELPRREITAEAWVRVDRPLTWGGILGAVQDNGSYERGWMLGYNDRRFSFAVAGTEGPGKLTYLKADEDFQLGAWYHVAGTYDGVEMKVYVNGRLAASSTAQKGEIHYPPQAFFEIGTYHDRDEFVRLTGMIHEVRLYRRVLDAEEIKQHYEAKQPNWSAPPGGPEATETAMPTRGPYLQFTDAHSAIVRWETADPSPTKLTYQTAGWSRTIEDAALKTRHEVRLTGLRSNTAYEYVIEAVVKGKLRSTPAYECDTFFNYSPPPVPERGKADLLLFQWKATDPVESGSVRNSSMSASAATAAEVLAETGIDRGICLVLGSGDGRLIYELVRQSRLRVIGVDTDVQQVGATRRALKQSGIYGARATVQHVESLDKLPFAHSIADLVVATRWEAWPEARRLLRPGGALRMLLRGEGSSEAGDLLRDLTADGVEVRRDGDVVRARFKRGPAEGTGVWSHQYGLADNSAFGGETLGGASNADQLAVQWIGRPGPRAQADRNGRKPSPLAVGGRLFVQGLHRIIAIDAYNGAILWSLEIPHFERFNIPRDTSNWCADADYVFAAIRDCCWRIDAADGRVSKFYEVVRPSREDWTWDWGYVARPNERQLIGSAVKAGSSWTDFWGKVGWYDFKAGAVTHKVCSDNLFSLEVDSGKQQWTYNGGLILNSTITIAERRVYFVECRHAKVIASDSRRVGMPELWQDQFLVALDLATGRPLWQRPIDTADGSVVFYLACGPEKLVLVASDNKYHVYAYRTKDGSPAWNVEFPWPGSDHGKHMSRPAISGGRVFVRPRVIELASGRLLDVTMPSGGCGTYAFTDRAAVFRARNVTLWDFTANSTSAWPRLRPGCWLSTIPACGMVLSPEGGGGCSCGSWLETSVGFMPKSPVAMPGRQDLNTGTTGN